MNVKLSFLEQLLIYSKLPSPHKSTTVLPENTEAIKRIAHAITNRLHAWLLVFVMARDKKFLWQKATTLNFDDTLIIAKPFQVKIPLFQGQNVMANTLFFGQIK